MSGNKNNFDKKYNFDLTNEMKPIQNNLKENNNHHGLNISTYNTLDENRTHNFEANKNELKNMINELDGKEERENSKVVIEVQSDEETKKIIADSKTYSQNLKRKVKLYYNLFSFYYQNFYLDYFNLSRKSSYMIIGFPVSVILFFSTIIPNHPLFGISFNISVVASIATFFYCYQRDMDRLASDKHSELGRKIRLIKNELVLYNPLANPILVEDEENQENYKI
jgi:hypothetical protein